MGKQITIDSKEKTITVKAIIRTPKGVIVKTTANEEYIYNTFELDEVLAVIGNVANITYDNKTKTITDAMFVAFTPDAVVLSEKLDTAKEKSAAITRTLEMPKPPISRMDKSVAISYAKDLVISGKLPFDDLLACAETFSKYMTGELEVIGGIIFMGTPERPLGATERQKEGN